MPVENSNSSFSFVCDTEGSIWDILHNGVGTTIPLAGAESLEELLLHDYSPFLNIIDKNGQAFDWVAEMSSSGGEAISVILSGVRQDSGNILVFGRLDFSEEEKATLQQMMEVYNEQSNLLRNAIKERAKGERREQQQETELMMRLSSLNAALSESKKLLQRSNRELRTEVDLREQAEQELKLRGFSLEDQVLKLKISYRISELSSNAALKTEELLTRIAALVPRAFSYRKVAVARIVTPQGTFASEGFRSTPWSLKNALNIQGTPDGFIEICYLEERPEQYRGPFSEDDCRLMDMLSDRISSVINQRALIDNLEETRHELLIQNEIANVFLSCEGDALYEELLKTLLDETMFSMAGICLLNNGETQLNYLEFSRFPGGAIPALELRSMTPSPEVIERISDHFKDSPHLTTTTDGFDFAGLFDLPFVTILPLKSNDSIFGFLAVTNQNRGLNEEELDNLKQLTRIIAPNLYLRMVKEQKEQQQLKAEKALLENEERYRSISEGALDAFYLLKAQRDESGEVVDFTFVDMNRVAQQQLNVSIEDVRGKGICELYPVNRESGFFDRYKKAYEHRRPYEGEYRIPNEYEAPGWYFHQVTPTMDGVAITNRDITAKKAAEEALKNSEEKFREVVEGTADLVLQLDTTGRIIYANHAVEKLIGIRPERIIDTSLYDYIAEEDAQAIREHFLRNSSGSRKSFSESIRFHHNIEGVRFVLLTMNLHKEENEDLRVIGVGQDITEMKRYEEELRASEERFKAIVSSASEAIMMVDMDGRIHFANDAAKTMFGLENINQLVNRLEREFFPTEYLNSLERMHLDVVQGRSARNVFFEVTTSRGDRFPAEISSSAIRSSDGEVIFRMSIIRNITDRVAAEKALKESERRYRTLVENIDEGIGIVDKNDNFQFVNNSAAAIFGTSKEEMLKSNVADYMPDDMDAFLNKENELRNKRISSRYEMDIIRKDTGEVRTILVSASPRLDMESRVIGTFATFHDITEKKKAEEELAAHKEHLEVLVAERTGELELVNRELSTEIQEKTRTQRALDDSRSKYRLVVENSSNAIAVISENRLKLVNPRFVAIFSPDMERIEDFDLFGQIDTQHREGVKDRYRRVLEGEQVSESTQFMIKRADSTTSWLESKEVRIDWENKPAILVFLNDITKEKRARMRADKQKEQLVQADKMASLGTLVAGVAHEINNPNNYILLSAQTMAESWKSILPLLDSYYRENGDFSLGGVPYTRMKDKIVTLSEGVFDSSLRIKELVNNLKDFARQGSQDNDQIIDMNLVLKSSLKLLQNAIEKTTNSFSVSFDENLPKIRGNMNRLIQVTVNLIQNATEALQDKAEAISVKTYSDDNGLVVLEVRDEGVGILDEHLKNVMDPFFTTKRDIGGTGLGLSISSGIIKDHGGRLTLEPNEGKGVTAKIKLPADNSGVIQ